MGPQPSKPRTRIVAPSHTCRNQNTRGRRRNRSNTTIQHSRGHKHHAITLRLPPQTRRRRQSHQGQSPPRLRRQLVNKRRPHLLTYLPTIHRQTSIRLCRPSLNATAPNGHIGRLRTSTHAPQRRIHATSTQPRPHARRKRRSTRPPHPQITIRPPRIRQKLVGPHFRLGHQTRLHILQGRPLPLDQTSGHQMDRPQHLRRRHVSVLQRPSIPHQRLHQTAYRLLPSTIRRSSNMDSRHGHQASRQPHNRQSRIPINHRRLPQNRPPQPHRRQNFHHQPQQQTKTRRHPPPHRLQ